MTKKIVVLFHGWLSAGNSDKAAYLTEELAKEGIDVISPTLPLEDPVEMPFILNDLFGEIEDLFPNSQVVAVGTSLGAFWAEISGIIENCKSVLVNPCFDVNGLAKYIGEDHANFMNGKITNLSREAFNAYCKIEEQLRIWVTTPEYKNQHRFHVITATGDDVISTDKVIEHYSPYVDGTGNKLTIYTGGDHRFTDFPFLKNIIVKEFE